MTTIPARYTIEFTPCTGFGGVGRTASLRDMEGQTVGHAYGHGATDQEAVLEALLGFGYDFDRAFDEAYTVLKNAARVVYTDCTPNA